MRMYGYYVYVKLSHSLHRLYMQHIVTHYVHIRAPSCHYKNLYFFVLAFSKSLANSQATFLQHTLKNKQFLACKYIFCKCIHVIYTIPKMAKLAAYYIKTIHTLYILHPAWI